MKSDPEKHIEPLAGHQLISVEKKDHTWFFRFTGESTLATESPWRLLQGHIVISSEDHLQQFALPEPVDAAKRVLTSTGGRSVESTAILSESGDLTIVFAGGLQLQLLQASSGYESWRLSVKGAETICTGGGTIVHRPK
ncbi:MAG TPA: DUF6188 family protein [Planctomycetota bacterium]|nr:DUF6188 family protein [Planctomycetota bacterium]